MTLWRPVVASVGGLLAVASASCPDRAINFGGLQDVALAGHAGQISPGRDAVKMGHNEFFSLVSSCSAPDNDPESIVPLPLLGATLNFTADLSKVGCACNLAVYLVSAPARSPDGKPFKGRGDYYCDANMVGGQWCPEIDLMEANNHAFQATPHKCDPMVGNHHYNNCDRGGCAQNTRDMGRAYGVGAEYTIDTSLPFEVSTTFEAEGPTLTGFKTLLSQNGKQVLLGHESCARDYLAQLSQAVTEGMSLIFSYWGDSAKTMAWMDMPPCGQEVCSGPNSGEGIISKMSISRAMRRPVAPLPPPNTPPPAPATTTTIDPQLLRLPTRTGPIRWLNHPEKCLTVNGESAGAQLASSLCTDGDERQFFESRGDGLIRWLAQPDLCVSLNGNNNQNGVGVLLASCEQAAGMYTFAYPFDDTKIHWKGHPERCLDVTDHSTRDYAPIQIWDCLDDDDDQIFDWTQQHFVPTTKVTSTTLRPRPAPTPAPTPAPPIWVMAAPVAEAPVTEAPTTEAPPPPTTPAPTTPAPTTPAPTTPAPTTPAPTTPAPTPPAPTASTSTSSQSPVATQQPISALYDCFSGESTWQPWSQDKRKWCCNYKHVGCDAIATRKPYDCQWGYPQWVSAWSKTKRQWCCENENRACEEAATTPKPEPVGPQFNCFSFDFKSWSEEHRTWCCQHEQVACQEVYTPEPAVVPLHDVPEVLDSSGALTYDCDFGFANWRAVWSPEQAKWCCKSRGRGCSSDGLGASSPPESVQDDAPLSQWVPVFDCDKFYWDWKNSWSPAKKQFCCKQENKGCEVQHFARLDEAFGPVTGIVPRLSAGMFCAVASAVAVFVAAAMGVVRHLRNPPTRASTLSLIIPFEETME